MSKKIMTALLTSLISAGAFAGNGVCVAKARGQTYTLKTSSTNILNKNKATGTLWENDRVIARFSGRDLKINYITLNIKATNDKGDYIEVKVTNPRKMAGIVKRVSVGGLEMENIPAACKIQ